MSEQFTFEDLPRRESLDAYTVTTNYNDIRRELSDLSEISETLLQDGPLATTAVLIPVAAHQESRAIYKTLSLYAEQKTRQPFSIVLSMNYPSDADMAAVARSFDELERAKHDFSTLDVRSFEAAYVEPTIGAIRTDLWDATLLAAEKGGTITPEQDMLCFNHDIDLEKLPRTYIDSIQAIFAERTARTSRRLRSVNLLNDEAPVVRPAFGNMKHAADPLHPTVSRAALWYDGRVKLQGGGFEAGLVMPMGAYAASGGFSPDDKQSEALGLLGRYSERLPELLRTPAAETSSRRLVEKLGRQNATFDEIWPEDTFAATEEYRTAAASFPDLSEEKLHTLVAQDSEELAYTLGTGAIKSIMRSDIQADLLEVQCNLICSDPTSADEAIMAHANTILERNVDYRAKVARMILTHVIKHPLADPIIDHARSEALKEFKIVF